MLANTGVHFSVPWVNNSPLKSYNRYPISAQMVTATGGFTPQYCLIERLYVNLVNKVRSRSETSIPALLT